MSQPTATIHPSPFSVHPSALKRPPVSLSWSEGRFFDLWMFVHLVAGFAGASTNVQWRLSTPVVFAIALGMMVVWEWGEWLFGIREAWENRLLDILVGLAGTALEQFLVAPFSSRAEAIACVSSLALLAVLSVWGWVAYRRRERADGKSA